MKNEKIASYEDKNGDSGMIVKNDEDNNYEIKYTDNIDKVIDKSVIFDTMLELINYLRDIRFDHAINYNLRNIASPLLAEIYKNKTINIKDILR